MASRNPRDEKVIVRFGANVRKYRLLRGYTMVKLAVLCDVEYGTISTVERGIVNCSISTAYRLSKALEVSVEQLYND